jgi:hypothetical protein
MIYTQQAPRAVIRRAAFIVSTALAVFAVIVYAMTAPSSYAQVTSNQTPAAYLPFVFKELPTATATPTVMPEFTVTPTPSAPPILPTATSTPDVVIITPNPASCHPSYPDFCIPPLPPDLNCDDVLPHKNFRVFEPDPHRLDGNNDGVGCEG